MESGFVNLNKPTGWTSHDCVARLRKLFQTRKIGHSGTLDPLATGVLPIAVGRATRLLQYLPDDKAYRAVIRCGLVTTTDDLEGEPLMQQPVPHLTQAQAESALPQFLGTIQQIPPRFSAVQVAGRRLYDLARQGKSVEIPARTVTIDRLVARAWQPGEFPELTLDIACGAGTYIRSLARDLGEVLGTGATLAALLRTQSSGFSLKDSCSFEQIEAELAAARSLIVPPGKALAWLPSLSLTPTLARRWCLGQRLLWESAAPLDRPLRILDGAGRFLGVGEINLIEQDPVLSPRRVFDTAMLRPDS